MRIVTNVSRHAGVLYEVRQLSQGAKRLGERSFALPASECVSAMRYAPQPKGHDHVPPPLVRSLSPASCVSGWPQRTEDGNVVVNPGISMRNPAADQGLREL
jgi:hypothetical protein